MKRSEAVNQLAGYLSTYHWYEEKRPEELVGLAETALKGMESIGMLPSTIRYDAVNEFEEIKNTDILHDNDISFAWEDE